jgi:hypothetical protein
MRAVVPELGVRAGAGRAERFVEGATADLGVYPAATAAPPALPAGLTPRLAGRLGDHTGCLFAANSAGQGLGWHAAAAQRTARGSKADRAAPTAGYAGLLVGWVGDQAVRTQRRPCSSRVAASRIAPQREQGWARDLATQLRHNHCPSMRRCSGIIRLQPGQSGRVIAWAPTSWSWSMSRSTPGAGARAPSPVSKFGLSSRIQASRRNLEGRENKPRATVVTASAGSAGSSPVTTCAMTSAGSRSSSSGHWPQRGCPRLSTLTTVRFCPQCAQCLGRGPHAPQYHSWPPRCRVRRGLAHWAQTGGEILRAPAWRSATSRSPIPRGAGERPSTNTSGRSSKAWPVPDAWPVRRGCQIVCGAPRRRPPRPRPARRSCEHDLQLSNRAHAAS